jgi:hypothetical protein
MIFFMTFSRLAGMGPEDLLFDKDRILPAVGAGTGQFVPRLEQ